jgi:hypothetical protein
MRNTALEAIARRFRARRARPSGCRFARQLNQERGEAARPDVRPGRLVIYGFSSAAPWVRWRLPSLNSVSSRRAREVGGQPQQWLAAALPALGLVSARGMGAGDPLAAMRKDVCMFANDKLSDGQRLSSVHQLLRRPAAESRPLLDRIERYTAALDKGKRQQPEVAQELENIAQDTDSRDRYLAFARDADQPQTRAYPCRARAGLAVAGPTARRTDADGERGWAARPSPRGGLYLLRQQGA